MTSSNNTHTLLRHSAARFVAALALTTLPLLAVATPLQDFVDRLVKREKLPGAVLLVSGPQGREIVAAGVANRKTGERVTPQTRFYIASSGKLVTAAATLQLVQEQKLRLDAPVYPVLQAQVPGIGKLRNIQQVTLEQLLQHRSGLAEYYDDDFQSEAEDHPDKVYTADESLAHVYGQKAQGRPGREFNYTNTNYVVLGRVLELVDQAPYASVVKRRIFDPVGMPATTVGARAAASGLAHGYSEDDDGRLQDVSYTGWNAITGDGAVVTTVADYEAFLHALFRDHKLLAPKTVKQMCTVQNAGPDSEYGLGCSVTDTPWGDAWGHNGSISGFNADTWYIPKAGITVVFFTNGDYDSEDPDVVVRAVKAYLRK